MNESKIAVLKYESNRCDSHEVFLFESEGAGNEFIKKSWHQYVVSMTEQQEDERSGIKLTSGCWCRKDCAQICYTDAENDDSEDGPCIDKIIWQLLYTSSAEEELEKPLAEEVSTEHFEKSYKDYPKSHIGSSDISSLILAGYVPDKGMVPQRLDFGEDGDYAAYVVTDKNVGIGAHYRKVAEFENWMNVYDDYGLVKEVKADKIIVYRAGERGCIIHAFAVADPGVDA